MYCSTPASILLCCMEFELKKVILPCLTNLNLFIRGRVENYSISRRRLFVTQGYKTFRLIAVIVLNLSFLKRSSVLINHSYFHRVKDNHMKHISEFA